MSPYFLLETSLLLWKCINFISYDLEPEAFNENHHFQKSVNAKIFEKLDKKLINISWIRTGYSEKSCIASFYGQPSANIDKKIKFSFVIPYEQNPRPKQAQLITMHSQDIWLRFVILDRWTWRLSVMDSFPDRMNYPLYE